MCGIAGIFGSFDKEALNIKVLKKTMYNRGPNSFNYDLYGFNEIKCIFIHSRLSIIDLHDRSNQPFEKDNIKLIFNGEIYNYIEIKDFLKKKVPSS